jgi:serine/threonine protein phosphatase PrpC
MWEEQRKEATAKKTFAGALKPCCNGDIHFAVSSMRGRRENQEDTFLFQTQLRAYGSSQNDVLLDHALFAVFDGHGTSFASEYAAEHFASTLCNQKSFVEYSHLFQASYSTNKRKGGNISKKKFNPMTESEISLLEDAIKTALISLDAKLLTVVTNESANTNTNEGEGSFVVSDAGTTAIIVMLTPSHIICGNLGDSRAILRRNQKDIGNTTICLNTDHKPNLETEQERICKAGGIVLGGKIEARLAVSRSLGDFDFKHKPSILQAAANLNQDNDATISGEYIKPEDQMVSSYPEITTLSRTHGDLTADYYNDKFLILASDGVWDVLPNEKCVDLITTLFQEGEKSLALVCEELLDQCYGKGSLDNITAILIRFASQEIGCGGGVMKRRKQRVNK